MKVKEIAKQFDINATDFSAWISTTDYKYKVGGLGGIDVDDSQDIGLLVGEFRTFQNEIEELAAKEEADQAARVQQAIDEREKAEREKQQALASMLVTSGFNFDGYSITRYSGYISGDDVVQIDRGSQGWFSAATDVGAALMDSLVHIRRNALAELKEAAYDLGCNAVIGVDFDYLTLDPETVNANGGTLYMPYVFGVTANGNAVIIKKD